MSMTRVTITVDEDVLAEVKAIAPKGEVSAFVLEAIREKLRIDPVMRMLTQLDEIYGPVTDQEVIAEAEAWGEALVVKMDAQRVALARETADVDGRPHVESVDGVDSDVARGFGTPMARRR